MMYELRVGVKAYEKRHIQAVLNRCKGNKPMTAKILEISLASLYRKINELGIGKQGCKKSLGQFLGAKRWRKPS